MSANCFLGIGLQVAEHCDLREGNSEVDTTTAQPLFLEEEGCGIEATEIHVERSPGDSGL